MADVYLSEASPEERGPLVEALQYVARAIECATMLPPEQRDAAAPFARGSPAWGFYILILYKPHRSLHGRQPLLPAQGASPIATCIEEKLICATCFVPGTSSHRLTLTPCPGCDDVAFCCDKCRKENSEHTKVCFLNKTVKVVGLISRSDLNDKEGTTISYNRAKKRYGVVLVGGEQILIKPENLCIQQLSERALQRAQQAPYTQEGFAVGDGDVLVRTCDNFNCGVMGMVVGAESLEKAKDEISQKIMLCGGCKDASYCSRKCQLEHWKWHKSLCTFTKYARKLGEFWESNDDANRQLCQIVDKFRDKDKQRRLFLCKCQDVTTVKKLRTVPDGLNSVPTFEVQSVPIENLRVQVTAAQKAPGDSSIWESVLERTEEYNIEKEICITITAPSADGEHYVRSEVITRRDAGGYDNTAARVN